MESQNTMNNKAVTKLKFLWSISVIVPETLLKHCFPFANKSIFEPSQRGLVVEC